MESLVMVVIVDYEDNNDNDELVRRIWPGPDVFIIHEREVLSEESILSPSHATAGLPVLIWK